MIGTLSLELSSQSISAASQASSTPLGRLAHPPSGAALGGQCPWLCFSCSPRPSQTSAQPQLGPGYCLSEPEALSSRAGRADHPAQATAPGQRAPPRLTVAPMALPAPCMCQEHLHLGKQAATGLEHGGRPSAAHQGPCLRQRPAARHTLPSLPLVPTVPREQQDSPSQHRRHSGRPVCPGTGPSQCPARNGPLVTRLHRRQARPRKAAQRERSSATLYHHTRTGHSSVCARVPAFS